MVAIHGIGSVPEPLRGTRPQTQEPAPRPSNGTETDGVEFSPLAAKAASSGAQIAEVGRQDEIREELVADVRQRIEDGTYELQEVVVKLASRISKFVA